MPEYMYILSGEKPFTESEMTEIRDGVQRLFKCTDLSVSDGRVFTMRSPFGPNDIEYLADEARKRFRLRLRGGGAVSKG